MDSLMIQLTKKWKYSRSLTNKQQQLLQNNNNIQAN